MLKTSSSPLLVRIKSWQFIGLGLSGWCTLYSVALLSFGSGSFLVGNAQGGCFAATMTLAGVEARRHRKELGESANCLAWAQGVPTEKLNAAIARSLRNQELLLEPLRPGDSQLGFGVRAVVSGRTVVYETARWQEAVIDLAHAESTDANRKKVNADAAFIVSVGEPAPEAKKFIRQHPLSLLSRREVKNILGATNDSTNVG